jgi:hypothetical protein
MNIVPIDMQMCIRIALPGGGNVLPEPRPLDQDRRRGRYHGAGTPGVVGFPADARRSSRYQQRAGREADHTQGVWSATIGPLNPQIYHYAFLVNGLRVIDPNNPWGIAARARLHPPCLRYAGASPAYYVPQPVPHGRIHVIWYDSEAMQGPRNSAFTSRRDIYRKRSRLSRGSRSREDSIGRGT